MWPLESQMNRSVCLFGYGQVQMRFTFEAFELALIQSQDDRNESVNLPIVWIPHLPHETARNVLEMLQSRLFSVVFAAYFGEWVYVKKSRKFRQMNAFLTHGPVEAPLDRPYWQ